MQTKQFGSTILAVLVVVASLTIMFGLITGASADDKKPSETTKQGTTATKGKSTVVYSYANVTATESGTKTSQLTIATGPDGKYHYVKTEDGKQKKGIWEGPLPSTPDVDKLVAAYTTGVDNPELTSLSSMIDTSIQDYLKAFSDR